MSGLPQWEQVVTSSRLTVICPVNHEADSVEQLRVLSDALRDRCAWVVVKNEAHSETDGYDEGCVERSGGRADAAGSAVSVFVDE